MNFLRKLRRSFFFWRMRRSNAEIMRRSIRKLLLSSLQPYPELDVAKVWEWNRFLYTVFPKELIEREVKNLFPEEVTLKVPEVL